MSKDTKQQHEIAALLHSYTPRTLEECEELAGEMVRYKDHGEWEEYNRLVELDKMWNRQDRKDINKTNLR